MAVTTEQIETAINAAGFTPATLTAFLVSGKLALELASIQAQIRNARAGSAAVIQDVETVIQQLQAAEAKKQAEIDALGT